MLFQENLNLIWCKTIRIHMCIWEWVPVWIACL